MVNEQLIRSSSATRVSHVDLWLADGCYKVLNQMEIQRGADRVARRYRVKYRFQSASFRWFDRILALFIGRAEPPADWNPSSVRRILIANGGHFGDLVLSTAVIQVVRLAFPGAAVGVLAGSWSRSVFENNPLVNRLHLLDHWYTSRAKLPRWRKALHYASERGRVIEELRGQHYDVALDVRAWFPNFIPVLWSARIPVRVGFNRVGFGPMLTHAGHVTYGDRHELDDQLDLIRLICDKPPQSDAARPALPPSPVEAVQEVETLLGQGPPPFIVLHMGSSTPTRDWPVPKWRELAKHLAGLGYRVVFTGVGEREQRNIEIATQGLTNYVSACDRATWAGLVELVRQAEMVYSTETSVGHVAAAVDTPVVAIYGGTAEPARFKPYGPLCEVVTHEPQCFPCLRKHGCRPMTCLTQLSVDTVWTAGTRLLSLKQGRAIAAGETGKRR